MTRRPPFAGLLIVFAAFALAGLLAAPARGQWTQSQRLNADHEANADIKGTRIYPARFGGFHATYTALHPNNGPTNIQYRRLFRAGHLGSARTVDGVGFNFNPEIAEAGDGSVHVVWENWNDEGPVVGWARSNYGGTTFANRKEITARRGAKFPLIEQLGPDHSRKMLMTYWLSGRGDVRYQVTSAGGTVWTTDHWLGTRRVPGATDYWANGEYEVLGSARNPKDGSVYRLYDDELNGDVGRHVTYARYDPVTNRWGDGVHVFRADFFARAAIAANDAGDVLVAWDIDHTTYFRVHRANGTWGPVETNVFNGSFFGDVVGVPGTNDFYAINCNSGQSGVFGRRYDGATGTWGPVEDVNVGQVDDFTPNMDLAADLHGNIYAAWEYWGTGKPQAWYSKRPPGGFGSLTAVPEPSGITLLALAAAALLTRGRRS